MMRLTQQQIDVAIADAKDALRRDPTKNVASLDCDDADFQATRKDILAFANRMHRPEVDRLR